jgi:hypothetical protein
MKLLAVSLSLVFVVLGMVWACVYPHNDYTGECR